MGEASRGEWELAGPTGAQAERGLGGPHLGNAHPHSTHMRSTFSLPSGPPHPVLPSTAPGTKGDIRPSPVGLKNKRNLILQYFIS